MIRVSGHPWQRERHVQYRSVPSPDPVFAFRGLNQTGIFRRRISREMIRESAHLPVHAQIPCRRCRFRHPRMNGRGIEFTSCKSEGTGRGNTGGYWRLLQRSSLFRHFSAAASGPGQSRESGAAFPEQDAPGKHSTHQNSDLVPRCTV